MLWIFRKLYWLYFITEYNMLVLLQSMYNLEQIKKNFSFLYKWYSSYFNSFKQMISFVDNDDITRLFSNKKLANCLYVKMSFSEWKVLSKKAWKWWNRWAKYYENYYFKFYDKNDVLLHEVKLTQQQFDTIQFKILSIQEPAQTFKFL